MPTIEIEVATLRHHFKLDFAMFTTWKFQSLLAIYEGPNIRAMYIMQVITNLSGSHTAC